MKKFHECIKNFYIEGHTSKEISEKLDIKYDSLKKYINRNLKEYKQINAKNKALKKHIKIKELYLKGYNAKEIAEILNFSHKYMREYISKNLKEYKLENMKNREINRTIIKAINSMNNSFIGNSALLKWNRQSYDYNENGNLVFNENRGIRTNDLPKTYYKRHGIINIVE